MNQLDLRLHTRAFHSRIPHIVVYKTWASQEWGQILEKPHYNFTKCCWPRIVCGLLLIHNNNNIIINISYITSQWRNCWSNTIVSSEKRKKATCKVRDSLHFTWRVLKINNMKKNWCHSTLSKHECERLQESTTYHPLPHWHVHWTVLQSWVNSCFILEPDKNPSAHNNSSFDLCKHFAEIVTFE